MWRKPFIAGICVAASLAVWPGAAANAEQAPSGGAGLEATLTGAEEVPGPGDPTASGSFAGTFSVGHRTICYELTYQGTTATAAHIHRGTAGEAGPVVVPLEPPADGSVRACTEAPRSLVREIVVDPSSFYVNVHSAEFPMGAARGQLAR